MTGLVDRLRSALAEHEAWARAASRPYRYADEGATVPDGGVHWRWVAGDDWDTTNPDPAVEEWVGGEPGQPVNLATVEEWPSTWQHDGEVIRVRSVPLTYANEIVEMDPAAAGLIQRYDPARVLRTIQAHREILALHCRVDARPDWPHTFVQAACYGCGATFDEEYAVDDADDCPVARSIAAIYLPDIETGDTPNG